MSMAFVINVIKWLLWTVETMYFDVVEPVAYIYSIFPRKVRYSWGLAVSRFYWVISECHSHPLRWCVAFTHIQHQGSLSSVTSPSANGQQAIHKSGTRGEVDTWLVSCVKMHTCPFAASTWEFVHAVLVIQTCGYPWVSHFQFYIYW